MRLLLSIFSVFLLCLGILLITERPAYAYTDPGTGLLAIQAAGSAMVAAGWYLRRKIASIFQRREPAKTEADTEQSESSTLP